MATETPMETLSLDEKVNLLTDENKKLKIDLTSLQHSNRNLVTQNRDTKKKVMDYRLQISDLESRLKKLESVQQDLTDSQNQCENLRTALDKAETSVTDIEYRASQAEEKVATRDAQLEKHQAQIKALEDQLRHMTDDRDRLSNRCNKLEADLAEAQNRARDSERTAEQLKDKSELLDKLLAGENAAEAGETLSEGSLAAANDYFKQQQSKLEEEIQVLTAGKMAVDAELKQAKAAADSLNEKIEALNGEKDELNEKNKTLQTRVKELTQQQKKGKDASGRVIGPSMPPWITGDIKKQKQTENVTTMEKLATADPAQLKTRIIDLEKQVSDLNSLLTYREDVILRIHEEITKKGSQLEAVEVERASLKAQVDIIKKELSANQEKGSKSSAALLRAVQAEEQKTKSSHKHRDKSEEKERRRAEKEKEREREKEKKDDQTAKEKDAQVAELEAECERLRGKRDREYQRRKRVEAELDDFEREMTEMKEKLRRVEEARDDQSKKAAQQSEAADKSRLAELQSTVSQLRMDNEAKRSELFDLRNKFEEKNVAFDKMTVDMRARTTKCEELETKLKATEEQLMEANKDLETVRCQVVRGGPEVQRLKVDLCSLQTTNATLNNQLATAKAKLQSSEAIMKQLRECERPKEPADASIHVVNGLADDIDLLARKLTETEERLETLKLDYARELETGKELSQRVSDNEAKIAELTEELAQCSKKKKKAGGEDEDEPKSKRSRKSRFDDEDAASEASFCSNCVKVRARFIETESQLKAALEREGSLRMQLKDLKAAGGSAVEIQAQLSQLRRQLKLTKEASERLLSALGPSMYDDPAVLAMREVLSQIQV